MKLDLSALNKAVASLTASVADATNDDFLKGLTESQHNLVIAGVIQNFEFCYELSWKFMKRWLAVNFGSAEVDGVPRRELYRLAHQNLLIEEVETWMVYHRARNQTSHVYDEDVALDVFAIAKQFLPDVRRFQEVLSKKNDRS
jgi:nucleotidyltransferase substrate binding protein (TIGR01987 family)